ncbi:MAG: hypothetical protein J7641_19820 [Cyanobacteria bacterium SID2]|nr:hypothetical protein [Cyanobacteria bacterium SID2]MBP0004217.1 hypothetical protein [Cyanobacteria bacterium SBC]
MPRLKLLSPTRQTMPKMLGLLYRVRDRVLRKSNVSDRGNVKFYIEAIEISIDLGNLSARWK